MCEEDIDLFGGIEDCDKYYSNGYKSKSFSYRFCCRKDICGIYKISNNLNKKIYIGSSDDIVTRIKKHQYELSKGKHHSLHFQNFYNKHDHIGFNLEVLEECSEMELSEREQYYLDTLQPFDENGFNIDKKARHFSEKAKHKLSKVHSFGLCQYDFSGELINIFDSTRAAAKAIGVPRESFNKAANGSLQTLKGYIWKYLNENPPNKLPKEFMDTIDLRPQKRIFAYSCEGELIAEFKNALDYQNKTGWDRKHIKKVCRRQDNRYKNLFWILEE